MENERIHKCFLLLNNIGRNSSVISTMNKRNKGIRFYFFVKIKRVHNFICSM